MVNLYTNKESLLVAFLVLILAMSSSSMDLAKPSTSSSKVSLKLENEPKLNVLPFKLKYRENTLDKLRNMDNGKRYTLLTANTDKDKNIIDNNVVIDNAVNEITTNLKPAANWDRMAHYVQPQISLPFGAIEDWKYGHKDNCHAASATSVSLILLLNLSVMSYLLFGILGTLNRILTFGSSAVRNASNFRNKESEEWFNR